MAVVRNPVNFILEVVDGVVSEVWWTGGCLGVGMGFVKGRKSLFINYM